MVMAATHLGLGQRVAIKFLHTEVLENADAVVRFLREARLAARIQSQHVARVMDLGNLEDGAPYIVMEYLAGENLAAVVARGPLPVEHAVDYVLQACDAMTEAHAIGIVHRDLKPSNLFLATRVDGSRIVKVLDFGVSKLVQGELDAAGLTRTRTVLGSPAYMSPEQTRSSRHVDSRTDIWAFGVIVFELLSGRTPFLGATPADIIPKIVNQAPPRLSRLCGHVPPQLEAAVMRCLQKNPADRFQTIADFRSEIAKFGSTQSQNSAHPGKPKAVTALAFGVLLLFGIGALFVARDRLRGSDRAAADRPARSTAIAPPQAVPRGPPSDSAAPPTGIAAPAIATAGSVSSPAAHARPPAAALPSSRPARLDRAEELRDRPVETAPRSLSIDLK